MARKNELLRRKKISQVEHSGHRIPPDSAGKMLESHWILQENIGNRWNMEAVFRSKNGRIFSDIFLSISYAFQQEPVGNHRKKSENFRLEYCFQKNHWDHPEPVVSGPDCWTWDGFIDFFVKKAQIECIGSIQK
jgi:hypothetical protein